MMKEEGKTLMELMVVAAIIGMAALMAAPNFLTMHARAQGNCVTEEIASELRLARQLAITHRDRIRIAIDREQRALITEFVNGGTTHHIYRYGDKGVVLQEPNTGFEILFYPSGRSASGTTIQLQNKEGRIQKLTVSLTGRVSIL